ncbi:MAG: hypothetical protein ABSC18_16710, partial [Verrucomicrobiota bacterium]
EIATPASKRAAAAIKSAEKGFLRRREKVPNNFEPIPGAPFQPRMDTDEHGCGEARLFAKRVISWI